MANPDHVIFRSCQIIAIILEEDTLKCCERKISEAGRDPCFESLQPLRHCVRPNIPVSTTSSCRISTETQQ
jgi:hypothetical protein